jgi:membrane protein
MTTRWLKDLWSLLKDSAIAWDDDDLVEQGAALAYYTVFALSPFLILMIVLSSVGFGQEASSGHLVDQIRGLIGIEGAQFVQTLITNAYRADSNLLATVVSMIMVFLGASAVFVQLRKSLNASWRVTHKPMGTIRGFIQTRLFAIAVILGIGFLLLVSLVFSAILAAVSDYLGRNISQLAGLVNVVEFLVSFVGVTIMFALMFKFIPDASVNWSDVWVGAAVTSVLFALGKLVIGLYLGNGAIGSAFGAASSLVIIMLWAFYSAQIVLFGAEFTRLYATRFGSGIRPGVNAVHVVVHAGLPVPPPWEA